MPDIFIAIWGIAFALIVGIQLVPGARSHEKAMTIMASISLASAASIVLFTINTLFTFWKGSR